MRKITEDLYLNSFEVLSYSSYNSDKSEQSSP